MAHEIAHNVLSHVQNEKLQVMLGSFRGAKSQQMASGRGRKTHPSTAERLAAFEVTLKGIDEPLLKMRLDKAY